MEWNIQRVYFIFLCYWADKNVLAQNLFFQTKCYPAIPDKDQHSGCSIFRGKLSQRCGGGKKKRLRDLGIPRTAVESNGLFKLRSPGIYFIYLRPPSLGSQPSNSAWWMISLVNHWTAQFSCRRRQKGPAWNGIGWQGSASRGKKMSNTTGMHGLFIYLFIYFESVGLKNAAIPRGSKKKKKGVTAILWTFSHWTFPFDSLTFQSNFPSGLFC